MRQIAGAWLEHQRRRFTRHDAYRYRRFDPRFRRGRLWFEDKAWADQPRVPAGSSEGGQWTSGGETPLRLAAVEKPIIAAVAAVVRWGMRLIDAYRTENRLRNLFGEKVGTAAVTSLDDTRIFGFNSGIAEFSDQYSARDETAANELRDGLLARNYDELQRENIGQRPFDALYHAETTVLLRAWEQNGRTLEGKELLVFVDGPMCRSCRIMLPYVGLELGNPTVTFVDRRGTIRTMRNGRWD